MALNFTTDPYAAWGTLLGTALGQLYNNNAQKRERTKADRIIEDMQNQRAIERIAGVRNANIGNDNAGQVIANQMAQQAGVQGATQATGMGQFNQPSIDFMGQGAQMAEQQDPYQLSVPSPLEQLKGTGGKEYAIDKALQANQAAINQEKAAQTILSQDPVAQARYNWNPNYTEDELRSRLREAGVRDEIIDEKVNVAKKDIAKRARDVLMPSIMQNLYGSYATDKDGNVAYVPPNQMSYAKAMIDLQTLAQYDPDAAKTFMSGAITPRDIYAANEENRKYSRNMADTRANAKQQHEWKREDTILANQLATERAKVTAAFRQSIANSRNGTGAAGLKMSDIKTLIELGNSAIASDNPALQKQGQQILAQAYSMLGGNNGGGSAFDNRNPDWNNYNDAMTAAHEALNAGNSKEQVAATLKKYMGDGDLYRKVISDLGIAPKSEPTKTTTTQTSSKGSFFPNWGGGQRGGLVDWLQKGGTVKSYFEYN